MKKRNYADFLFYFRLNNQRMKHGKAAVYLRLMVNNRRAELATHQYIEPRFWDQKMQCVRQESERANEINGRLNIIKANVLKHYNRMVALDLTITSDSIKNAYLGISENDKMLKDLMDFYYSRFKEKVSSGKKAKNTLKSIYTTIEKLKKFVSFQYKVSDVQLKDIKLSFVSNFEHFLTAKQGLTKNSAMKYIRILKRMTKFAVDQDWIKSNRISQFRCTYNEPERDRLTMDEIIILYRKEFSTERLSQVRDVFVFCCFTGFSYLEVYNLTRQHIVNGIDGGKWIAKCREKTKSIERVPLLPISLEIIEKYKDNYYCVAENKLLPVNTNQCYNEYLKEIAIICKIDKRLTTHVARHTFATAVTLENDVPIETVSQMLGHKSIKTTQLYAKVTQRKMSNNMNELKEKLRLLQNEHIHSESKLENNSNC